MYAKCRDSGDVNLRLNPQHDEHFQEFKEEFGLQGYNPEDGDDMFL
jgi:hypothetical protein